MIDRIELVRVAQSKLGAPYLFGAKWSLKDGNPQGPIDCSGFIRWVYAQGANLLLPDGSSQQFAVCKPIDNKYAEPGDLGFFRKDGSSTEMHHVGMILDDTRVIEARGKMSGIDGQDVGEHVILRPRARWEAWKDFTGWMRPYVVLNVEGKEA